MRKDYALVYTDIVDSTAVHSRLGDAAMTPLWDQHDQASRELLRQWRGREIDRSDGFLVLFEQPGDAAAFCAAYHALLATLPVPLRARAGLHVGPLTLRENAPGDVALGAKATEVVGLAKAVSARLMALAHGGQTLASAAACQALQGLPDLQAAWKIVSHGHWRMKGLDQVIEVFEVGDTHSAFVPPADGEKSQRVVQIAGAWVGVREVPKRLPAERDSFVGRLQELNTLATRFADGARLLTITGPGGMGKTRLALRYAWAWLGSYPGGLWFCDLSSARGLDGLMHGVGQGLDVPLGNDPVGQLGRAIAGRGRCLVILDNFEQLVPLAHETLGHWLDAAREAAFLVTSREVLNLAGEGTLALAPLPPADGAALFHQRARAAHAAHDARAEPEATHALVELLDGLPLAIELAAPRVRVMPTPQLLARMGDRFRLLAGPGSRPSRQATLRATLAWSWDLLSPDERAVLAQLAVFEGGFAWPAVQAVVSLRLDAEAGSPDAGAGDEAPWIIDLLQALVDKSLVTPQLGARFSLLRSVQEFAAEELAREGSFPGSGPALAAQTRRRHCVYFAGLSEREAAAGRCVELDNLVRACEQAATDGAADLAVASLRLAWRALRMTGPFAAATRLTAAVRQAPGLTPLQGLWVDHVEGLARLAMGDQAGARAAAERTLQAAQGCATPEPQIAAQALMGEIAMGAGEFGVARAHLDRAQEQADTIEHDYWRRWVLNARGALYQYQARYEAARECFAKALAIGFADDDKQWQAAALGNLAGVHLVRGEFELARQAYEQSLRLSREVGSRRFEGNARCNLGLVLHELGLHGPAMQELQLALETAQTMGYARLVHVVRCNLGLVAEAQGDLGTAAAHFAAARDGAQAASETHSLALYLAYLAQALCRLGLLDSGRQHIDQALGLLAHRPDPMAQGLLQCSLAVWHACSGQAEAAGAALQQARGLMQAEGLLPDTELGRRVALTDRLVTQGA
jgi:predicted ATPase/class 3 adenylate cyclase